MPFMFSTVRMKKDNVINTVDVIMTSLPVEVLVYIKSFPEQSRIILLLPYKFRKDSLINKEILPISKKVHVFFLRHPVVP